MEQSLLDLPERVQYRRGPILDQGATSTCVGHGVVSLLNADPVRVGASRTPSPFAIYDEACQLDPWPENDHDVERSVGTSVRAGIKAAKARGFVSSYHWAADVDDILRWMLSGSGPILFGLDWYAEMFRPTEEGIIRARGSYQGGHCLLGVGADRASGLITLQQSWGATHGGWYVKTVGPAKRQYMGCVRLPLEDLDRLMREAGEAAAIIEAPYVPTPPRRAGEE